MTLTGALVWGGSLLTLAGLAMIGWCVLRALAIRRAPDEDAEAATRQMQTLVAVNMAAVGIASIGLACVTVGLIL